MHSYLAENVFEAQNLPLKKIIEIGNWITIISTPEVEILKKKIGTFGCVDPRKKKKHVLLFVIIWENVVFDSSR